MDTQNPTFAKDPEAALGRYLEIGYHVEPNVWDPKECKDLIEASHRLPSYLQGQRGSVMNPHALDPIFLTALANPKIKEILQKMVSGPVSGLQTQFFYGPPGARGFSIHQDNFFVHAKPDVFVSAWSPMEPVEPENGGLFVYPRSHKLPILPVRDLPPAPGQVHDPNSNKIEAILPEGYEAVHLSVEAGSAVFLQGNIVHGSNQNRTQNRTRHVLLSTYIRTGEPFRAGTYAKRSEIRI